MKEGKTLLGLRNIKRYPGSVTQFVSISVSFPEKIVTYLGLQLRDAVSFELVDGFLKLEYLGQRNALKGIVAKRLRVDGPRGLAIVISEKKLPGILDFNIPFTTTKVDFDIIHDHIVIDMNKFLPPVFAPAPKKVISFKSLADFKESERKENPESAAS